MNEITSAIVSFLFSSDNLYHHSFGNALLLADF